MSTATEDNRPDTHQDHLRCHIIREEHSYCSVATQCTQLLYTVVAIQKVVLTVGHTPTEISRVG